MGEIKRYEIKGCADRECSCFADMVEDSDGDWIQYSRFYKEMMEASKRIMTYKTDSGMCNGSNLMRDMEILEKSISEIEAQTASQGGSK